MNNRIKKLVDKNNNNGLTPKEAGKIIEAFGNALMASGNDEGGVMTVNNIKIKSGKNRERND